MPINACSNKLAFPKVLRKMENEIALQLKDIYKVFCGDTKDDYTVALDNINLDIFKGSLVVIGGANGSGKSVLMTICAGLTKASQGSVYTSSKPGLVFQDASAQILGDSVREDVAIGPRNIGIPKKDIPLIIEKSLNKVSLLQKMDFPTEFLSGGEKRRLAVASILAMDKEIIIFDEPYANLDYPGIKDVNALIKELHKQNKTLIILTHEIEKCLGLADKFVILYKGKKVFDGNAEEGIKLNLEQWGIRQPLVSYKGVNDLVW